MSSSYSPCAACKCLRRKCTNECVFAPYFPPDNPQKFTNVHKVFGASNVSKILNELNPSQRADAVHSLAYEADCRLKDPVYGCVAHVSILQHRLKLILNEIELAKKELATYIGPTAMLPVPNLLQQQQIQQLHNMVGSSVNHPMMPYEMQQHMLQMGQPRRGGGGGSLVIREPQQQQQLIHQQQLMHQQQQQQQQLQQILEAQQLAAIASAREQEMLRALEQQQQLQLLRLNNEGFEEGGPSTAATGGLNELPDAASNSGIEPSLALGASHETNNPYHHQIEQQIIQGGDQEHYSHSQSQSHSHSPYELLQQQHEFLLQQQQQQQQLLLATHQQLQLQQLTQPQASNSQQHQTPKENSGEDARSIGP